MGKLLGAGVAGAVVAALIFLAVLILADLEINEKPSSSEEVSVPTFVGLEGPGASARADDEGLAVKLETASIWDDAPSGLVVEQRPPAGTEVRSGTTITLVLGGE